MQWRCLPSRVSPCVRWVSMIGTKSIENRFRANFGIDILGTKCDNLFISIGEAFPKNRGVSIRTALVYDGELDAAVVRSGVFDAIIPFPQLLGLGNAL